MCSKGGGSPPVPSSASTAFQSTVSPSPTVAPLYTDFINRANAMSNTPFNPAMQGAVAPMNAQQIGAGNQIYSLGTTGMDAARASLGTAAGNVKTYGEALGEVGRHMGDWDPSRVKEIMSPFTEEVVGATQNWFNNQNAIQGSDLLSQAIRSGNAFGGDRAGVAEGILAGQQQLSQAPVIAGLRQAGYTQALDEYNRLKQFGLAGAEAGVRGAQAGLGASEAEMQGVMTGIQGAGAAMGWGGLQQAQTQRELDVAQQNAMMSSAYPFQTLNWYGSILGGIGPLTGSFAQGFNTPPDPNSLSTALGIGSAAVGLGSSLFGAGGGSSGGGAAGAAAPAATQPAAAPVEEQARGGIVGHRARRARGGLVPVFIRHNGGLVPGLAYGGGVTDEANQGYRRDEDEERDRKDDDRDYSGTQYQDVQGARKIEPPNFGFGQLKVEPRQLPQPIFPSSGGTQPQQKSQGEQLLGFGKGLLDLGVKAAPLFAMMSDPKTKTDIQRVGRTDDGEPLHAFRYKGDPKTYPKVVGPMAVSRRQAGGEVDDEVMSDETPDPVLSGQQYARDYAGRTTWFNPRNERGGYTYTDDRGQNWTDTGAMRLREGPHASGLPSATRGFATPGRSDLGNWFEVNAPGGRRTYAQKTDIGPPGVVDLNAPLAASLYGSPNAIPGGQTYVRDLGRNRPEGAGADAGPSGPAWPDPSKGNVIPRGGLPSGEQPSTPAWQVPGARRGREPQPTIPVAGPSGRGPGTGPDGGKSWTIPGLERPAPTFAQSVLGNPLTQFGASLLAQRSPYFGVNLGNAMLATHGMQEKARKEVLDEKPQMMDVNGKIGFRMGNKVIATDFDSPAGRAERRETEAARRKANLALEETEEPGEGLFGDKKKRYWRIDPETGERTEWVPPPRQGETRQDVVRPVEPQQPAPQAPATPPAPARPYQQTEAATPPDTAPAPDTGTTAAPAPQQLPATRPPASARQTAQAQPPAAAGPTMAGPDPKAIEADWTSGRIAPAGTPTDPQRIAAGRNEAVLQGLPSDQQEYVKSIADYRRDPRTIPAKHREKVLSAVSNYDPSWSQANYATRSAALKNYTATGVEARNIQSHDMAVQHLGRAFDNLEKLNNTRVPWWNDLTARAGQATGMQDPKYTEALATFRVDVDAVGNELMRAFRGTGSASEREAVRWRQNINEYDNPVALRAALKEAANLLDGRIIASANRYNDAMGPGYERPPEAWLSGKSQETIRRAQSIDPQQPIPPPSGAPQQQQRPQSGPTQPQSGPAAPAVPDQRRQEAIDWLRANPNHPQAPAVKQRLGI